MAGPGGVIASAVGKEIIKKLGKFIEEETALQWRFKEDVLDMEEKMKNLENHLLDADDKSRQEGDEGGRVGQEWLTKCKHVAYDTEDVLDELDANKLIKKSQSKFKLWFSRNNQLLQRITMPHKIKNVSKKIDKIKEDGLRDLGLQRGKKTTAEGSMNNEPFAPSIGEGMVGRKTEKENIISLLTSEANTDISIIPVVGLGGIGKTTLVQSVLDDRRVNVFDVKVFVHVSKPFNLQKIVTPILKCLNSTIKLDNNCNSTFLHDHLKNELAGRRYFIVLDDLWEENGNRLEELKQMLQYGRKGSRIVVTTRHGGVVQRLRTGYLANIRKICPVPESDQINLDILSSEDCWRLMKQRVFGPDDHDSGLEDIGMQIAQKCGGLPLVANALGQVMSDPKSVEAWKNIRDTKVDLGLRCEDQKEALEKLMLSYYYMKPDFKMCFAYLAVFPNAFVMNSNHLIQQWNALGYISSRHDGQRCINYLLGMSFLKIDQSTPLVAASSLHANAPPHLVMHDMAHDLASIIFADEFIDLDATQSTNGNKARYCRHVRLTKYKNDPEVFKHLPGKVRSVHFRDLGGLQLPQKAFSRSKYIRVLDLSQGSAKEQSAPSKIVLPSSVHRLKLLRYLDTTGLPIASLPKYFHTLQNMETLIMSNSSFETLHNNICSLHNLCYLDLSGSSSLSELPSSLGELSKLLFLNLSGCSMLQVLPESICKLTCLYHLDISDCFALQELPDKFGSLPNLSFLNISSCSKLTKLPDEVSFPSLEHLNLSSCHQLESLPKYFGCLPKLEFLNLSGCYKLSVLPESFCQLGCLKHLDISDCGNLKELNKCFGDLLELEYLNLTSCSKLRLLPESLCKLHKLRCLYLSYCLRLQKLPSSFGDLELQILHMNTVLGLPDCPDSIGDMTSLSQFVARSGTSGFLKKIPDIRSRLNLSGRVKHHVHEKAEIGCSSIVDLVGLTCSELILLGLQNVRHPQDAERVKLRDNSDIRVLVLDWENVGDGKPLLDRLKPPRTLEQFFLAGYPSKDFPDWMSHISSFLPFLSELSLDSLESCDCLPPFGALPNLRSLHLENIPNIRKISKGFYGEGGPCMKLRVLRLCSMENLVEWWTTESGYENNEFLIPNLHHLEVVDCQKLKFLPYPPRSQVWSLKNSDQVLPELGFGMLSTTSLPFTMSIDSCNFSQDKWDRFQHFPTTLEWFYIKSISGLRTLPEVMRCFTFLSELNLISLKDLETLPVWLGQLTALEKIYIRECPELTYLPESIRNLTALRDLTLKECEGLEMLPESLGQLTALEKIWMEECPKLTYLPESIKNLTALRDLTLKKCEGLEMLPESLGQLTALEEIWIQECPKLTYLPESIKNLTALRDLTLKKCEGLEMLPESLGQLTALEEIWMEECPKLTYLPESIKNLTALRDLTLKECKGLKMLPESLGQLTALEEIYIQKCPKLTYLPESIKNLTALRKLKLIECEGLEMLPESLGQLTALEEIYIQKCPKLTYLPESIKNLSALRDLTLKKCEGLEMLPESLGQLTDLEEIWIQKCPKLTYLPKSIKNLNGLKRLYIYLCPSLIARCQGEDFGNICHIPTVEFRNREEEEWQTLVRSDGSAS